MNGSHYNGNGNGKVQSKDSNGRKQDKQLLVAERSTPKQQPRDVKSYDFDQSIVLRQSPIWSRGIMLSLMALSVFGIVWANLAKIEQAVPAAGQLKPEDSVKEVQAPVNGVVKIVHVEDGQSVKPGDLLLTFDTESNKAELDSLNKVRDSLIQENQLYSNVMGSASPVAADVAVIGGRLSQETGFLLKNRAALVRENILLRNQLQNNGSVAGAQTEEQLRLQAAKRELDTRAAAAQLEVEQIKQQLAQNNIRIQDNQATLVTEAEILSRLEALSKEGAIAQLQFLQQRQKVQSLRAEISQLSQENKRLQLDIEQGRQQVTNTVVATSKTVLDQIAENKQRLAEIDSQLGKIRLENNKRLAEINGRIAQTKVNVKYQELRAPVGGKIFNLQAKSAGFVANPSEKVLEIVPEDNLVAEIFITNRDIGFVREGMKVDVRIDSFPFSEFGDIKGELISIGSDALPPDQTHQFYRFPAQVRLKKQSLNIQGRKISLQSGMSVTANIKVREERTVMSLFTEMFIKQVDSLKEVR